MEILISVISLISFVFGIKLISDPDPEKSGEFRSGITILLSTFLFLVILSFLFESIIINILSILLFFLFAVCVIQGIVFVKNDPITEIVITKYGVIDWKKKGETISKKHGNRFLFLKNIIYGYIEIVVEKINWDLGKQKVITPDGAINYVPIQYTYTPGPNFYNYIKSGKEKVKSILDDQIREKTRIWASSEREGPKTWEDMRGAGDEAISVLIKLIAGENLTPINFPVPTWRLFQYYGKVHFYPSEKQSVMEIKSEIESKIEKLSDEEKKALKERVEKRWEIIVKLRQGNGTQIIPSLGITLNRFNIGEIEVDPDIEKAIKKKVIEREEAGGEKEELDNIRKRIFELVFLHDENGVPIKKDGGYVRTSITEAEAIELLQSERKKITKSVEVKRNEIAFDKKTLSVVGELASTIIKEMKKGGQ